MKKKEVIMKLKRFGISIVTAAFVTTSVAAVTTIDAYAEEVTEESQETETEESQETETEESQDSENDATDTPVTVEVSVTVDPTGTPTVTIAPVEEDSADDVATENKVVTAAGAVIDEAKAEIVNKFLEEIEVTDDFVVYADEYSTSTHIDGNIAVNELNSDIQAIKTDNVTEGEDTYSYIGESNGNDVQVLQGSSSTVLVHGSEIDVNNKNGGSTTVDLSDVDVNNTEELKEVLAESGIDSEEFAEEIQINENLSDIAEAGEKLNEQIQANDGELKNEDAVAAVNDMLDNGGLSQGDIAVINIDATKLSSQGDVQNYLQTLFSTNANVGATIIVNLNIGEATSVEVYAPINSNAYGHETGYLVWNFGSFAGDVTITQTIAGIIIAPNANVVGYGVINGRVVANSYYHTMETHQPKVTPTPEEPTPTPEEPTPTPEEPTPTPEEPTPTPEEPTPTPEEPTPTPEEPTPTPEEPTPTPEEPTPTPEEPTPTPNVPTPTPNVPTPTPNVPTPTPNVPTSTPSVPTPTTTPNNPVIIEDEETPLAETPEGEVLGVRRGPVVVVEPTTVPEGEVLGARRAPQTGDDSKTNLWTAILFGAVAGMGAWAFTKKREEKVEE